uniref:Uncharacterized protein n=1 Tax=Neobodo designis TaxID=312471 RepID=A0A7S1PR85_NEODS|mmetsp:Transcript_18253/g.56617  ORF Transcript_18253/g.56617 Transcript_18253/m.56617 type:complete len:275 (+) Transcript_18253:47-871(+)
MNFLGKITGSQNNQNEQQGSQQNAAQQQAQQALQAAQQVLFAPKWSTRMGQCDPPATCEQWAFSCFCHQCAAAKSKTLTDGSDICYNFFCWHWIGGMSYVRREYGIKGSCGDDLMCGLFCIPCLVRRGLTESELRGVVQSPYRTPGQQPDREWATTLFACGCCEFFEALLCPFCVAHYTRNLLQPYEERGDCCFDMMCLIPFAMYGQARHRYGIVAEFGCIEDICVPVVCYPCAIAQARREAEWRLLNTPHVYGMTAAQGVGQTVLGKLGVSMQ